MSVLEGCQGDDNLRHVVADVLPFPVVPGENAYITVKAFCVDDSTISELKIYFKSELLTSVTLTPPVDCSSSSPGQFSFSIPVKSSLPEVLLILTVGSLNSNHHSRNDVSFTKLWVS